ncbi:hypothetical protein PCC7424_2930 [Gloeothece citriformis PCC 7424]|uniref:Uncharacterized protein n=1 Tax=Gloeothece citriformis (strain PCC 7424) TaxID=65393 RepID=B7K9X8_GLOC7|nr:hypothetical protein [Gloeothece citriformis]ACK71334.1 hypothetical protein PCC7424_2930 [Gloeothece citriformis PCC 7424]
MTRQPHDQFAKQYLEELLSPLGTVEISREVSDETRPVDVFFSPTSSANDRNERLGLLESFSAKLDVENWSNGIYFLPESLRSAVIAIKFGELDASLAKVIDVLLRLSPQQCTRLLLELSRKELIERFGQGD